MKRHPIRSRYPRSFSIGGPETAINDTSRAFRCNQIGPTTAAMEKPSTRPRASNAKSIGKLEYSLCTERKSPGAEFVSFPGASG